MRAKRQKIKWEKSNQSNTDNFPFLRHMMKVIMAFLTCFIFLPAGYGQTPSPMGHTDLAIDTRQLSYEALTSSNLPIIFINTSKRRIGNDKSIADAGIIWNDKN